MLLSEMMKFYGISGVKYFLWIWVKIAQFKSNQFKLKKNVVTAKSSSAFAISILKLHTAWKSRNASIFVRTFEIFFKVTERF